MEPSGEAFAENEEVTVETASMAGGHVVKVARIGIVSVLTETFMIVEVEIPGYRRIHVVRYRTSDPGSPYEGIARLKAS